MQKVKKIKYLGFIIDKDMNLKDHIDYICNKNCQIKLASLYRVRQIVFFGKCFKKNFWIFSQTSFFIWKSNPSG